MPAIRPLSLVARPLAAATLATFLVSGLAAEEVSQPVQVEEIARSQTTASGQPLVLPPQGAEVVAAIYTIAPGASLPVHRHPYARYAYILTGVLEVVDAESGEVFTYRPGDFVIEMTGTWHWGRNRGTEPVRLVVIDQAEPGVPNTELKPD